MLFWNHRPNQGRVVDLNSAGERAPRVSHVSIKMRRFVCCWMLGLGVSLLAGCGESGEYNPTGEVSGKVTIKGKPLTQGRVNYISDKMGVGASGNLTADGTYKLEGPIPVGLYKVFITFDISPAMRGTAAENVLKTVPEKYQSQATSDLTADLEEGLGEHNFDLK